ncbi:MAG: hypothetical protein MJ014_00155 [Methanocorpusculum sp.]|nr:hypothetical protein [Methanocorpusculum sp.]
MPTENNFTVPEGTIIHDDGFPRLTYGGFVGSAIVNPAYAVHVKNSTAVVDFRDFFSLPDNPQNSRRYAVSTSIRHFRQQDYAWQMMRDANIPMYDVLYLPNGFLSAAITKVKKHLIGTTDGSFGDVLKKVLKQMTIRVAYKAATAAGDWYTTKIIDPLRCKLRNQQGELIENWPQNKNCIEQNNLQLEVPEELLLENAPEWMLPELKAYTAANGRNSLVLRIRINGKILKWLQKGWTAVQKAIPKIKEIIPVVVEGVNLIKMIVGVDGRVIANKVYRLHSIDDLMLKLNGQVSVRCISPMSRCPIIHDLFPLFVSRNGYTLDDLDVEWCTNFTDLARHEGFSSIDAMLNAARGVNGSRTIWKAYPYITAGLRDMGIEDGALTAGKAALPDEVDYRTGVYPLIDGDNIISSMDATGIGGKTSRSACWVYPKDGESAGEDDAPSIDFADEYSIGGNIPRSLGWELDPDFEASGGTMENVGRYLLHAEFEFSRINLYLDDEHGFRVPCSDASVSVLNFDTSKPVEHAVATLKIMAQGSTVLTAQFPYSVVEDNVKMMLSETTAPEVHIGSKILPQWLVNVASDRGQEEIGYKNIAALTTSGYTFTEPDMSEEGEYEIEITPVGSETVSSTVRVVAKDMFAGMSASEFREKYSFFGWLDDRLRKQPNERITASDIKFVLTSSDTGASVYYGTADSALVEKITVNGSEDMKLTEGLNYVVLETVKGTTWQFSVNIAKAVERVIFQWSEQGLAKFLEPISEKELFDAERGLKPEDFVCRAYYKGVASPRTLDPSEYDIEIRQPYEYYGSLGACYIRPYNIAGLNSAQYSLYDLALKYVFKQNEETRRVTLASFDFIPYINRGSYLRYSWLDPEDVDVELCYQTEGGGETRIWVNSLGPQLKYQVDPERGEDIFSRCIVRELEPLLRVKAILRTGETEFTAFPTRSQYHDPTRSVSGIKALMKNGFLEPPIETSPEHPYHLAYGQMLRPWMVWINAILPDGTVFKDMWGEVTIEGYDATQPGAQTVTVWYGDRTSEIDQEHVKSANLYVYVDEPDIVELKVLPKTARFFAGDAVSVNDFDVTAVSASGQEIDIPESEVMITEFTSTGDVNQTGMLTAQYPAEGTSLNGSIAAATYRYDIGEGGGGTEFNLPGLLVKVRNPKCWMYEVNPDFGLELACLVASDGSRTIVPLENVVVGPIDTTERGHYAVTVTVKPDNWTECFFSKPLKYEFDIAPDGKVTAKASIAA